jgi:hypothetical protein
MQAFFLSLIRTKTKNTMNYHSKNANIFLIRQELASISQSIKAISLSTRRLPACTQKDLIKSVKFSELNRKVENLRAQINFVEPQKLIKK